MDPATDTDILRQQAYATDDMLKLRYHIHETYSVPKVDFREWVLSRLHWSGTERVLDIGCGPGVYLTALAEYVPDVTYFGLDFSEGMLAKHPQRRSTTQADSQDLPYATDSFDVVMANHMLYHLPDIDRALTVTRSCSSRRSRVTRVLPTNTIMRSSTTWSTDPFGTRAS
jgi:SAM-dependent methyltransferase